MCILYILYIIYIIYIYLYIYMYIYIYIYHIFYIYIYINYIYMYIIYIYIHMYYQPEPRARCPRARTSRPVRNTKNETPAAIFFCELSPKMLPCFALDLNPSKYPGHWPRTYVWKTSIIKYVI